MMPQDRTPPAEQWRMEPPMCDGDSWMIVIPRPDGRDIALVVDDEPTAHLIANAPANARLCEELADALAKADAMISGILEAWPEFTEKSAALARVPVQVKAALKAAGRAPG